MSRRASDEYFDRYPCLVNKFGSDVGRVLKNNRRLLEKHIRLLEASQTEEEEYFWSDLARSNLLAYLCGKFEDYEKQHDQIKKTLMKDDCNITALLMKLRLGLDNESQKEIDEARHQLDALQNNSDKQENQKIIAKAELAYAFSCLSPRLYQQAIATYESVISDYRRLDQGSAIAATMNYTGWCFHLAQTYSRTLNTGRTGRLNAAEVFGKIHDRLAVVIESTDKFYKGKAMVELVDAYKKCETAIHRCEMKFPIENVNPDEYIFQAMREAPDDPYVLERCGRHYRQRATTKKQFLEAIAVLKKATELCPSRHVSWHHMGLAYRSLWLETGNYEEARLHRNYAKKGHKKSVAAGKKPVVKYDSQDGHSTMTADEASCTYRKLRVSVGKRSVDDGKTHAYQSARRDVAAQTPANDFKLDKMNDSQILATSSSEQKEKVTDRKDAGVSHLPQRAPVRLPTLQPKVPAPKQSYTVDYFDKLRSNNPLALRIEDKRSDSTKFLEEALKCFQRACDHANNISCRYFIDLGRTYFSLGRPDEAKKCFLRAHRQCKDKEDNDSQYLYEQWAMLLEQTGSANDDNSITEVMAKYRKAILAAIRAKVKSKISYYRLREILADQLKGNDNDAYRLEYHVLNLAGLNNYDEQVLVTAMRQNKDDICKIALEMINLLHKRSAEHDLSSAFLYLTALHQSGELILRHPRPARSRSPVREGNEVISANTVIGIVTSMRNERNGDDSMWDALRDVYRWYVGETSTPPMTSSQHEVDVCILAPSRKSPGVDLVKIILKEKLRLEVRLATWDGDCDILPNKSTFADIESLFDSSKSVIIIEDTSEGEWWDAVCLIADTLLGTSAMRDDNSPVMKVCLVAHPPDHADETKCSSPARYRVAWPSVVIQLDNADSTAVSIVRELAFFYGY